MQRPGRRRSVSNPSQLWSEEQLLADVEGGPQGPRVGAFLDFDGTLINGYSLSAFARHHLRSGQVAPADLGQLLLTGLRGVATEEDFERLTVLSMRVWPAAARMSSPSWGSGCSCRPSPARSTRRGGGWSRPTAGPGTPSCWPPPPPGSRSSPRRGRWAWSTSWCRRWRS